MASATTAVESEACEGATLSKAQYTLFKELIYQQTGIALVGNKAHFVESRLRKRLRINGLDSFAKYYKLLRTQDPDGVEMQEMVNRVTTNKTNFFRENHHFEFLRDTVFAKAIAEGQAGKRPKELKIWCAAASSGEEPYTLAITAQEAFAKHPSWDVRILATDIDTSVLEKARQGVYPRYLEDEIPPETLAKHFKKDGDFLRVHGPVKDLLKFHQLNLLDARWPLKTQFDVIFIRNVLIYFDQPTQDRIMRHIAQHLAPDGYLFIGHSESLSTLPDVYHRVGKTIYQKVASANFSPPPVAAAHRPVRQVSKSSVTALPQKRIVVGEVYASDSPMEICTTLGSCIAVCIYDEKARVGGMNHFALPDTKESTRGQASFGVHAMELLINRVMNLGGHRDRLQAKVFGGADVANFGGKESIGKRNIKFVQEFLETESIPLVSELVGGEKGMQVRFEPQSGRARVKLIDVAEVEHENQSQEIMAAKQAATKPDVTLF